MALIPYGPPAAPVAGDTWAWRVAQSADYPIADGWALSYALVSTSSATQAPLTWSTGYVTNDGAEYTVTIPASVTAGFVAGGYRLVAYLTLAAVRHTVCDDHILVQPNVATLPAGQG